MKLSKGTLTILANFAAVNPNIHIAKGNMIKSKSPHSFNSFLEAKVEDEFPVDFSVYSLPKLLATLSLFDDPELVFSDTGVTITSGNAKAVYTFSDPMLIDGIKDYSKTPKYPEFNAQFILTNEAFKKIEKSAKMLGSDIITFEIHENYAKIVAKTNDTNNSFSIEAPAVSSKAYTVEVDAKLLNLIPGDYDVEIADIPSQNQNTPDRAVIKLKYTGDDLNVQYIVSGTVEK